MASEEAVRNKAILRQLLPTEHGSWAFVLEPLLVALIFVRGLPREALPLAGFFAFLAYRPLRLAWHDIRKGKQFPRTRPAILAVALLGVPLLYCLFLEAQFAQKDLPYLATAFVLGVAFVWVDRHAEPRSLVRELLGSILMVPLVSATARVGGSWQLYLVLPALFSLRAWSAVLAVRAVFRRTEDWIGCQYAALILAAGLLGASLFAAALTASLPLYIPAILRTFWLGATPKTPRAARTVGVHEAIVSVLCVLNWVLVFWLKS